MDPSRQNILFPAPQQPFKKSNLTPEMTKVWMNEKFAPELLQYQEKLLSEAINTIEDTEKKYDTMTKEVRDIVELDIERLRFLVKDYFRIRLAKIQKFMFYILKENLAKLLSKNEIKFIVELANMKTLYYNEGLKKVNVLCNNFRVFMDKKKNMSEKIGCLSDPMIEHPDDYEFVCAESLAEQDIILDFKKISDTCENEYLVVEKGSRVYVPFLLVRELVAKGDVKLI